MPQIKHTTTQKFVIFCFTMKYYFRSLGWIISTALNSEPNDKFSEHICAMYCERIRYELYRSTEKPDYFDKCKEAALTMLIRSCKT